jgi:hypothetical protein
MINIKLHFYQSWVSSVSIQGKCHVVILVNDWSLKNLIESIFKTPKGHSLVHSITRCRCLGDYFNMWHTPLQHVGVHVGVPRWLF